MAITGEVSGRPSTFEGQILKLADGIAYINHDLDDALRGGMLHADDIPTLVIERLGTSHGQRINALVTDAVAHNEPQVRNRTPDTYQIALSADMLEAANTLRDFLFAQVYAPINRLPATQHAEMMVERLFKYYVEFPEELPSDVPRFLEEPMERHVADIIAGMTDRYAVLCYERRFRPLAEEW
jgi:dGTPase